MSQFTFIGSLIFSALLVLFGIGMVLNPTGVVIAVTILISIVMIISGIANVGIYSNFKEIRGSIYYLIDGIISIILGILLISSDEALKNFLPYLIGFWLILKGASSTFASIEMRRRSFTQWYYMLLGGVAIALLGILIIFFPIIVQVYIGVVLGVVSILVGIFSGYFTFRIRRMGGF